MNKSTSSVPNENIIVETDDTQNVYVEYEDRRSNPEYDFSWLVMTNSDENESQCSDENVWYSTDENDEDIEEPTCYNSGLGRGYASFDDTIKRIQLMMSLLRYVQLKSNFMNLPK